MEIYTLLVVILIYAIIAGFPAFLTVSNIANLLFKKRFIPEVIDILIFIFGPPLTLMVYHLWNPNVWNESIYVYNDSHTFPFHEPISNHITILVLSGVAILGYAILRIKKASLPPLIIVLCMAAMYMGCALSIAWILQLLPNITEAYEIFPVEGVLMSLFPLNFIICSISIIHRVIQDIAASSMDKEYQSRLLTWSGKLLKKGSAYPLAAFILMWPLFGVITAILVLFGQEPDAVIKAFTNTSDWLMSQKISPPNIILTQDCYVCTAAAGGHQKIVKPQRMGIRRGNKIVVNRQLCVSKAFEELLQEKTPRFHKLLRRIYDAIGCPIARRIRTPFAADVAYIVIKPLEWLLLIILYLVEVKPENRIARQYLPTR